MEKAVFPVYRYTWEDFSLTFNENWCFQLVFCFYIPPVYLKKYLNAAQ